MYNKFYNFKENPFNLTPDPRFIYLGPGHQEALEHMIYGIEQRKGFILVAGHIGAGKTTLTRLLLDRLQGRIKTAMIFNTFLNEIELLRSINREFDLPAQASSREALVQPLNQFLLDHARAGGNAVLILDEAQNLSVAVLEQIRMLSNLETDNQKLIQIILIGQPELAKTLHRPDLAQLNQRITVRCSLNPLNLEDTTRYILHRLSVAGPQGTARFDTRTFRLIHRESQGVPRRINAICDRALLVGFTRVSQVISTDIIRQAVRELNGETAQAGGQEWWKRLGHNQYIPAALIVLGLIIAAYFGFTRGGRIF